MAKKSKEEIQKEIDRIVEEKMAVKREKDHIESKKDFVVDALNSLIKHYKYGGLKQKWMLDMAKKLIEESGLDDETKDELARYEFAQGLIYFGGRGVKEDEKDKVDKAINSITKYLRGQT